MEVAKLFYVIGTLFGISAILYFTWEYIIRFSPTVKSILILVLAVFLFFVAELMRGKDI